MTEVRIERKELWSKLGNIKKIQVWLKAAENLGLNVTQSKGGTSHYALRKPGFENWDIRGLITTIYCHGKMRKDVNEAIFKSLLDNGFKEDDVWKAIKLLD